MCGIVSFRRFVTSVLLLVLTLSPLLGVDKKENVMRVMQMNILLGGSAVKDGKNKIVDRIFDYNPDIVLLCEVRDSDQFCQFVTESLAKRGRVYYAVAYNDDMVISRCPITRSCPIHSGTFAETDFGGHRVAVCSMHLNYCDYACYLPRGYDGASWQKMPEREKSVDKVIEMNLHSERYKGIEAALKISGERAEEYDLVLIGGDFNEPSHLDWTERTRNLFDHNGIVMEWHSTKTLEKAGFIDSYRKIFPDEVKYPAFTWPVNNPDVSVDKLAWAPESDERDRIDFIFYNGDALVKLCRCGLVGPDTTILRGERDHARQSGEFIRCNKDWPSDHAGTFAEFEFIEK